MHERISGNDKVKKLEDGVRDWLSDIKERSQDPDLLDKVVLPVERYIAETLESRLDINPGDGGEESG